MNFESLYDFLYAFNFEAFNGFMNLHRIRQILLIIVGCLIYAIGYYHRNCPSTLSDPMSQALKIDTSQMIKLTSMFFWPYALIQPFVGSISDVIEVSYFISGALILSSISVLICGLSRNYTLTCIARCFVGLSSGSLYVPIARTAAQWFSPKAFPFAQSIMIAFGDIGAIVAQGPLKSASTPTKWPIPFYIGSGIDIFLAILAFFIIKNAPNSNKSQNKTFKEFFINLKKNVYECLNFSDFWFLSLWKFLTPAFYSTISSNVGITYLRKGLHFDQTKSQYYITITSITSAIGSPIVVSLSHILHTRKWLLLSFTLLAVFVEIILAIFTKFSDAIIILLLFLFALTTGAGLTLAAVLYKEMLRKELVGTLLGCGNLFLMIGTFIQQMIISAVVKKYENEETKVISFDAFRYGVWTFAAIVCFISIFFLFFVKDSYKKAIENQNDDNFSTQNSNNPLLSDEHQVDYIPNQSIEY